MKPIEFEEQNVVFGKNQPEYLPLPAFVEDTPERAAHTCWELTDEEIEVIKSTKKIYLSQLTFGQKLQPIRPDVNKTWL